MSIDLRRLLAAIFVVSFSLAAAPPVSQAASNARNAAERPQPAFTGPKKTIAVSKFEATGQIGGFDIGEGLSAMLVKALQEDGRFIVIERSALAEILSEQQLAQTGVANPESGVQAGGLLGANILVRGAVTKFDPQAGGGGFKLGIGGGLLGGGGPFGNSSSAGVGIKGEQAQVEINLRLIDSRTGRIIATPSASGVARNRGLSLDIYSQSGVTIGTESFARTPLGEAAQTAIQAAVARIWEGSAKVPWSAAVIDVGEGVVYVNAGATSNVRVGDTLKVYRIVRELKDPRTGILLDTIENTIGSLRIESVRDEVSTAVITGGGTPQRGDTLRLN